MAATGQRNSFAKQGHQGIAGHPPAPADKNAWQLFARAQPLDCRLAHRRESRCGIERIKLRFNFFLDHGRSLPLV